MRNIRFALAGGGKAKPPYFFVQPGKGPKGLKGFTEAVAYLVRGWVITGVISGKITLVYPKNIPRDEQRRHAKAVVQWARPAVMREAKRQLAELPLRFVELWKGHEVAVPPFAVTTRVLLLPETSQREFEEWWDGFLDFYERDPERIEENLRQEEAQLRDAYRQRWGALPPDEDSPYISTRTIEDHVGVYDRSKAIKIVERRWEALREEQYREALAESKEAPDLYRSLGDAEYLAEQAVKMLRIARLDFPVQFTAKARGGVHPLWAIWQGAQIEAQWGALADRLGTSDKQVLMAARRFQRLRNEGRPFEEALKESGCPLEVAQRLEYGVYYLLDNVEDPDAVPDIADEPDGDKRKIALWDTLEAWGLTVEEALALEGEAAKAFAESVRLAYEELLSEESS